MAIVIEEKSDERMRRFKIVSPKILHQTCPMKNESGAKGAFL